MGSNIGKTGVGVIRGIQLIAETRTMLDPSKVKILNDLESGEAISMLEAKKVVDLSKQLHKEVLKLKGDFLQPDGSVKYAELRESLGFIEFQKNCSGLKKVDIFSLNEIEKKTFFINIYNTLTIHAFAQNVSDQKSVLQLEKFWQMYAYKIGELQFSLDDIEHGVLRCNKLHPTYKDYFFKVGDPRRALVMSELDPRIHFALNCGAMSCPPLRLFSADNLDQGLDIAAKNFCQNDVHVEVEKRVVMVSKILDWYREDFGPDQKAIVQKIMPYCKPEQQSDFQKIQENFKLSFSEYDWSIH
ncbi:uncharacterized protein LOC110845430 [Folsomia candida]|uniref:uncharacterized protein LOC110845430 n=1 Tax=Folsomia candida TaxID=158441 RepID=UPI000B8FCA6B|nr:uncharacterized protein LOC110845430 [Folsomia candida]